MPDACLWLREKTTPVRTRPARAWDAKAGAWVPVTDDLGNPVRERIPAVGTVGEPYRGSPQPGRRFATFLRHDGAIISAPLTGAAAAMPGPDRSHSDYAMAKAKHFGWVEFGRCPLEEHQSDRTGFAMPKLIAASNREAAKANQRCAHWGVGPNPTPCAHWLAEVDARRARRKAEEDKRAESYKSEDAKHTDAIKGLVETLAGTIAAKADAPAPQPGRRG